METTILQSVFDRFARSARAREALRATDTDALRILDGGGDAVDGVEVDDFNGNWLAQSREGNFPAWLKSCSISGASPNSIYWKKLGDNAAPAWIAGQKLDSPFVVKEAGISYWIDFNAGYSQGLFLDQRLNRARVGGLASNRRTLNCFAYTCAFGARAAAGGAETVNIDLSRRYLEWGKENYLLNGIDPSAHEFLRGDVFEWLKRFAKRGKSFDLIILDPPTFSRDDKGRVFTIETRMPELVTLSENILTSSGTLLCSTNQRSLGATQFHKLIFQGLRNPDSFIAASASMPPEFTGDAYLKTWWLNRRPPRG